MTRCKEVGCENSIHDTRNKLGYCRLHRARYFMRIRRKNPKLRKHDINRTKEWRKKIKLEIFRNYSNGNIKCVSCGYDDIRALCLDHIKNDGAFHRRRLAGKKYRAGNSYKVYLDLRNKNFPKGYQLLCCNCNRIKEYERQVAKINIL